MQRKISIIIGTDFFCWIPFVTICCLHTLGLVDATPWYALFSIVILPINSVINPLLYDDTLTTLLGRVLSWIRPSSPDQNTATLLHGNPTSQHSPPQPGLSRRVPRNTVPRNQVSLSTQSLATRSRATRSTATRSLATHHQFLAPNKCSSVEPNTGEGLQM